MTIERRDFLKGALAGSAMLAAGTGAVQARENQPMPEDALGLLYDSTLCIGCKACVAACKQANDQPAEFSTKEKLWDTPLDISGKTKNVIKMYKSGSGQNKDQEENGYAFMKVSCMHCVDPSCVSACPVSAMKKDAKSGIVSYDADACIGCRYCVAACPFGVPRFQYDEALPKINKCELCRHRMPEGKYAACAEVCPTGATLYGPVKTLMEEAKRRKALPAGSTTVYERGQVGSGDTYEGPVNQYVDHIYGEKEVAGTQVLKLSGIAFDKLGMPSLPERAPAATSETMQHTLYGGLVAPLVVLGGLVALAKRNVKPESDDSGS